MVCGFAVAVFGGFQNFGNYFYGFVVQGASGVVDHVAFTIVNLLPGFLLSMSICTRDSQVTMKFMVSSSFKKSIFCETLTRLLREETLVPAEHRRRALQWQTACSIRPNVPRKATRQPLHGSIKPSWLPVRLPPSSLRYLCLFCFLLLSPPLSLHHFYLNALHDHLLSVLPRMQQVIFRASFHVVAARLLLLLLLQGDDCWCYQYKVGDLDYWGLPPPSDPLLYSSWSRNHCFRLGDSLLFLYPPSQDSVMQVTERAFNSCSLADPIRKLDDGNSLFNLTTPGNYYFTSGAPGHCEKNQKLAVAVPSLNNGTFFPPAVDFAVPPAGSQSYLTVFGPAPAQGHSGNPAAAVAAMGSVVSAALLLGVAFP